MDLQTRKISFIQSFLTIQDEKSIARFESVLNETFDFMDFAQSQIKPMSTTELNARIHRSETDFENNRFKTTNELLQKFKK